jgi:hypothetical protein
MASGPISYSPVQLICEDDGQSLDGFSPPQSLLPLPLVLA